MKKLILLLLLFASSAHAGLLTGQTPSNHIIPSGWTLVKTQDFESGCGTGEMCDWFESSIRTSNPHTGTYSLGGTYDQDQDSVGWFLQEGMLNPFTEVYISYYEFIESQALFNDEFWAAWFRAPDINGEFTQEVILNWYWASDSGGNSAFNGPNTALVALPQGNGPNAQEYIHWFHASEPVPRGEWVQWEIHYRPNTTTGTTYNDLLGRNVQGTADGFLRVYKNGEPYGSQRENVNLNGGYSMNNMQMEIGGLYTKLVWMYEYPACNSCAPTPGYTDMCREIMPGMTGQTFADPYCNPTDPPLPSFSRYFDDIIIMKTTGTSGGDVSPPYTNTNSPAKNSTGWPVSSRTVSFYVRDDTNVVRSSIAMTIDGTPVTPTITPTGTTATSYLVSYTRGSNWADNTVYTVGITAQDVYSNTLNESYTFQTAETVPVALAVTTTTLSNAKVGNVYSATLAATGGVSPYTWDNVSVLPAGLSIPTSGTGPWGVPTATFSGTITVRATDSVGATDNQDISFTVDAADIPGYPTVEIGTVDDTYMNSGAPISNFSTGDELYVYTWPTAVTANRILMKWDLSAISGTVPTTATLRLYMTGYSGNGGDNTYTITVRRITGVNPTVSLASWSYYNGSTAWTGGSDGGIGDAGEIESTAAVTKTPQYVTLDVTAMVKAWLLTPSSNKGMLIGPAAAQQDSNRHFGAYDNPTAAYRPVLFLTYVPEPSPVKSLTVGQLTGGTIQ